MKLLINFIDEVIAEKPILQNSEPKSLDNVPTKKKLQTKTPSSNKFFSHPLRTMGVVISVLSVIAAIAAIAASPTGATIFGTLLLAPIGLMIGAMIAAIPEHHTKARKPEPENKQGSQQHSPAAPAARASTTQGLKSNYSHSSLSRQSSQSSKETNNRPS